MLPGDFGQAILGQAALPETVAAFRQELGLDKPAYIRYFDWALGAIQGDLGTSFSGRNASGADRSAEVVDKIAPRLWNTLFLASMAALIAVPLSLILGILTALYRNSFFDRSVNTATLTTISFPEFFVAYILILFFASLNQIFPSLANVDPDTNFGAQLLGVISINAFVFIVSLIVWAIMKNTIGIRLSKEGELKGTDVTETGVIAYAIRD